MVKACLYLEVEMISLGTRFPRGTHFRTWMFATLNISMHRCIPVGYDISLKSVQADFALMHALVMPGLELPLCLIFLWNHGMTENRLWPSGSLLLRPRLQHAPWQREGMWGGFWETEGEPHDVSHSDPDRQEQALVRVQCCHHYRVPGQRSRLVNTSSIYLSWFQSHSACKTTDLGPTSPQLMCNLS